MCIVNWKRKVSFVPSVSTEFVFFPIVFCNVKTAYYYAENHTPFPKKKTIPINCVILRIISMNDCFSITSLHMIMQRTPSFSCKKTPKKTSFWELFLWMTVSIASWYKENNFFVHPQSFLFYFIWVCIEWIQKIICSLF